MSMCRPYRSRKQLPIFRALGLGIRNPNKTKSIYGRAAESFRRLNQELYFLAGFLTLLPHLNLRREVQLRDEGEKLLIDAYSFLGSFKEPSVRSVRRLRVLGEKILKFVEKVERDLKTVAVHAVAHASTKQ